MKKRIEELPRTVEEIGKMKWEGNIIPNTWYQHIKFPKSNKPNRLAIEILAEIIYWYRPVEVRDEISLKTIGWRKKFKSDVWQVNYEKLQEKFGATRAEVKSAVDLLVDLKLIKRTFRNFKTDEGLFLSNVMYLEPIVTELGRISFQMGGVVISNSTPSPSVPEDVYGDSYGDSYGNEEEERKASPSSSRFALGEEKELEIPEPTKSYLRFMNSKKLTKPDNEAILQNPDKLESLSQFGFERAWEAWDRYDSRQKLENDGYRPASTRTFSTFLKWSKGKLYNFVMDQFIIETESKNLPQWDYYIWWNSEDGFRGIDTDFADWLVKRRPDLDDVSEYFYTVFSWSERFAYLREYLGITQ